MCCVMNVKEVGKVREQLVARRFREYRVTRNLTQKEVATSIGCNLLTYCGYEHGRSFPRLETLIRLRTCTAFPWMSFCAEIRFFDSEIFRR